MNALDIVILVVLAIFLIKGLVRGVLKELCSLAGLLGGAILAYSFHNPLADLLVQKLRFSPSIAVPVAFLAIFLTTILFFAVLGHLLSRFVKLLFLGGLNHVAGGFFGLAQGVMLLAIILFALTLRPAGFMSSAIEKSELSPPFIDLGDAIFYGSSKLFQPRRSGEAASATVR